MTVEPYLGCPFAGSRFDYINRRGEEIMSKKHSKMSLPVQMVIGLVLGVIVGSMTSAEFTAAYLRPFGQLGGRASGPCHDYCRGRGHP